MQSRVFDDFYCLPGLVAIRLDESLLSAGWKVGVIFFI